MKSVKYKILAGSFIDIFGTILASVISFAIVRLYFQVLTKEEFGLWLAINGVASLIALVDLGVDQYFTTLIASDKTFYKKTFNTEFSNAIVIKICVALFFMIIGAIMFFLLTAIIDIKPNLVEVAKTTFAINVVYLILNIFFNSANTILAGRNHFSLINSIITFSTISSSILTYVLLKLGYGILAFPLALLILAVFQFFLMGIVIWKKYPHIRFGSVDFKGKKGMISYSFSFQLLRWAHIIRTQYIFIAINNYSGPSFVTLYNMTNKIPTMIPAYFNKIVMPLFPSFSKYISEGDYNSVAKIVLKLTKILFRFSLFFSIAIWLFNKDFVDLWVGTDKYGGTSLNIWIIVYMFAFSAVSGFGIIIYSTKKFEKWTHLSIAEIFLVIALSYIFNKYYGFIGTIAGFTLGSIPTQIYIIFIALRQINLNVKYVIKETYKYILIPNFISLMLSIFIKEFVSLNSWSKLICAVISYTILHVVLFEGIKFVLGKDKDIKARLVNSFAL